MVPSTVHTQVGTNGPGRTQMHPITSHEIAGLRASELRREATRHNAHARRRPVPQHIDARAMTTSPLLRVWTVLVRRLRPV